MTIRERIINVVKTVLPDLQTLQDDVFIIGASALILSGINIENTPDIDILTSSADADRLKEKWKDRKIESYYPADGQLFRSNFSRFSCEGLDVEVMGDLEICVEDQWHALTINDFFTFEVDGGRINLPTLDEQKRILKLFGREKDLQRIGLIQEFLDN